MTRTESTARSIYLPLRLTYGLVPLLAGLDKFCNLLADWPSGPTPWRGSPRRGRRTYNDRRA